MYRSNVLRGQTYLEAKYTSEVSTYLKLRARTCSDSISLKFKGHFYSTFGPIQPLEQFKIMIIISLSSSGDSTRCHHHHLFHQYHPQLHHTCVHLVIALGIHPLTPSLHLST